VDTGFPKAVRLVAYSRVTSYIFSAMYMAPMQTTNRSC